MLRIYRPGGRSPERGHVRAGLDAAQSGGGRDRWCRRLSRRPAGKPGARADPRAAAAAVLLRDVQLRAWSRAGRGRAGGVVPPARRDHRAPAQARQDLEPAVLVPPPALGRQHHAGRPAALGIVAVQRDRRRSRSASSSGWPPWSWRGCAGSAWAPSGSAWSTPTCGWPTCWSTGERITVIDFEDCGLSWYLYDLACALTFNEGRADVGELIALWVDGYRQVEHLSAEDEKEIDTFLMLRRLMLTRVRRAAARHRAGRADEGRRLQRGDVRDRRALPEPLRLRLPAAALRAGAWPGPVGFGRVWRRSDARLRFGRTNLLAGAASERRSGMLRTARADGP